MIAVEDISESDAKNYYWLDSFCTNCELDISLAYRKGYVVENHECPRCGNKTLVKQKA